MCVGSVLLLLAILCRYSPHLHTPNKLIPAINRQIDAGKRGGTGAREKQNGVCNLERLDEAMHRRHAFRQLDELLRQAPAAQHRRPHGARRDAVDAHAVLDVAQGVGAREGHDAVLGRAVA